MIKSLRLRGGNRNSSIELLKIVALFLIVTSHVNQTLYSGNSYIAQNDYVYDIYCSTTDPQLFLLAVLGGLGAFGNTVFFICSAWFLLDKKASNTKKVVYIVADVWLISIIILVLMIGGGYSIGAKLLIAQLFPITFTNNWYISCYVLFYLIYPFLNIVIENISKICHFRACIVLFVLYMGINFIWAGPFFASSLTLWVTIYFMVSYMKNYLQSYISNLKFNLIVLILGLCGNFGLIFVSNIIGLHIHSLNGLIGHWNKSCNPFYFMIVIGLFNIIRSTKFQSNTINYLSSLSLLVYIIHENILIRTFLRPKLWIYVHDNFGYKNILLWLLILSGWVFIVSVFFSIIYKELLQKKWLKIVDRFTVSLSNKYIKLENFLLQKDKVQ